MIILNQLLPKCFHVELTWVKAHNNYTSNERADKLARNAVYNNIIQFNIDPPHTTKTVKRKHLCLMYGEVGTQNTSRITKLFHPHPNRGKGKAVINKIRRKKARHFVEIITGQNNMYYVQNKVNQLDLLCKFSEEEETFDHLLFVYPCFETWRRKMNVERKKGTHNWNKQNVIIFSCIKEIDKALKHGNDNDNNSNSGDQMP